MKPLALILVVAAVCGALLFAQNAEPKPETPETGWKAAVATAKITPGEPLPMSGYAARKDRPSEGTEQDLFAKALALEDAKGERLVVITADLIGIRSVLRDAVVKQLEESHGLPAEHLLMNGSHTHCGPSYLHEDAEDYYAFLVAEMVRIAREALDALAPAKVSYAQAKCGFAMNRRTPTPTGYRNHPNPEGPVDHTVPVLRVDDAEGELRAVLFGYACHNTTMGFMKWLGDYAGYAQEYFEEDHPGVTAMFMANCAGDQNPYPRRMLYFAQRHGRSLATAVEAALEIDQREARHQRPLKPDLAIGFRTVPLEFVEESGRDPFPYPVQVIRFGKELALVALGNEVVVDYSLRLKDELGSEETAIWVAGYSNSYSGYIPSRRVLLEGGYEAESRPWKPELEERIVTAVHDLFHAGAE